MSETPEEPPEWVELRERLARERVEVVTARRELLDLVPGNLRDLDAAASCDCSCHPQPGRDPHHGSRCECQLRARARRRRHRKAMKAFAKFGESLRPVHEAHQGELAEAATELGVDAHEEVPGAPWVVVGTTDGTAWYVRERWDTYAIVVSTGPDPSVQPWGGPDGVETETIRTGTSEDLYQGTPPDYRVALRFIVATVREYLDGTTCTHPARPGDRYCPRCGNLLVDPAKPRNS
ncbi:hypothetical protein [Cellulomonas sp.]|uniref:hypothetical protein n=1 Tax=Cellulomonas sp. TaxID=40001 RepID=UPI003BAC5FDC